ncbi:MAG TPA: hypothetical protein VGB24_23455 [Longimicrobium sp.]|jgi:tetratricopeptide (TPR) repeat protein|uniref:tetratricopeptide repeat protein n=1 Tax=Longimicrobium sp. TaxID=2029185 RepID=UPI002EDA73CC
MHTRHPALDRAQLLINHRRFQLAEDELRRGLGDEPENAMMHAQVALCMVEDPARAAQALEAAKTAVAYAPNDATVWHALARVAERCGKVNEAEHAAAMALSRAPRTAVLLLNGAQLLLARGWYRAALGLAERALEIAPNDANALMTAGALRSRMGLHNQARANFERALALEPDDKAVQANAGWAALRRGDAEAAVRHFRTSLRLDPEEAKSQRGLLEALRARNPAYGFYLRLSLGLKRFPAFLKWVVVAFSFLFLFAVSLGFFPPRPLLALQVTGLTLTVLIWTAPPLADLLLLRSAEGRQVLDPVRKAAAVGTAALLAVAAALGVAHQLRPSGAVALAAILAVQFTIPLSTAPRTRPGRQRAVFGALVGLLAVFAIISLFRFAQRQDDAVLWLMASAAGLLYADVLAEYLPGRR